MPGRLHELGLSAPADLPTFGPVKPGNVAQPRGSSWAGVSRYPHRDGEEEDRGGLMILERKYIQYVTLN